MVILIELSTISKVKTTDRRKSNHHRQCIRQRQQNASMHFYVVSFFCIIMAPHAEALITSFMEDVQRYECLLNKRNSVSPLSKRKGETKTLIELWML